jgi:hypothetical protein
MVVPFLVGCLADARHLPLGRHQAGDRHLKLPRSAGQPPSFQQWASQNQRELLALRDVKLYEGLYGPNHYEFGLLCIRSNRTMPAQRWLPESRLDEWREEVIAHVAVQVASEAERLLISAEALSLLRHEDEVAALAKVLEPRRLQVAVCLRHKEAFLESYRQQLFRMGEIPSRDRTSYRYVEPDSWLVQWDHMLSVWRQVIGDEGVVSCGYEDSMAIHGSSIPAVLEALDIDPNGLPAWDGFTRNATSPTGELPRRQFRNPLRQVKRSARAVKRRIVDSIPSGPEEGGHGG